MGSRYTQLQPEERITLASLHQQCWSQRTIAKLMHRSASTISRELRRNRCESGYASKPAQRACQQRRIAARPLPKLHADGALWRVVCDLLAWAWSPQQISATLRRMHPDEPAWHVSHETIYNAIYAYPRGQLRQQLISLLRQGKSSRRPRAAGAERRGQIPEMVSIHVRPPEVDDRVMPGHWEGDLIKGAGNKSAVGVLVERATRLVLLCKMPDASAQRSGAGNLDSLLGGNSGHNAGPKGAGHRSFDGQEISAAHPPHPHAGFQGAGRLGGLARRQDVGRSGQAV